LCHGLLCHGLLCHGLLCHCLLCHSEGVTFDLARGPLYRSVARTP
jgi:hypothetical protein